MHTSTKIALVPVLLFLFCYTNAQTTDTSITEIKQNGVWQNQNLQVYTYDDACRITNQLFEDWYGDVEGWVPSFQNIVKYNKENKVSEQLSQQWDFTNNVWINSSRFLYKYNTTGTVKVITIQYWNNSTNIWDDILREIDSANNKGNNSLTYIEMYVDSKLQKSSRTYGYFDANNNFTSIKSDNYVNAKWIHAYKTDYNFYNDSLAQKGITYNWDTVNNQWTNSGRQFYNYLPLTFLFAAFVSQDYIINDYINSYRYSQTYNPDNTMHSSSFQFWDNTLHDWTKNTNTKKDYYADGSVHHLLSEYWYYNTLQNSQHTTYTHHGCILQLQQTIKENNTTNNQSKTANALLAEKAINKNGITYDEPIKGLNNKNFVCHYVLTATPAKPKEMIVQNNNNIIVNRNDFSIAPNPAKNYVVVTINDKTLISKLQTIRLSDLSGKIILTERFQSSGTQKIMLPTLSAGTYIISIETPKGVQSKILVIQ